MSREAKIYSVVLTVGLIGLFFFQIDATIYTFNRPKSYPSEKIENFTLGYNNAIAGIMWLQFLPDNGTCDQNEKAPPTSNPSTNLKDTLNHKIAPSRCHLSWVYHMLNVMSVLNPKFRSIYHTGATILNFVVDDREGARLIYEKGLQIFPNDWQLNYKASALYLTELQDRNRSIELLQRAYDNGGPKWIPSLIAGIYSEMGQLALARTVIVDLINTRPGGYAEQRANERLKEIDKLIGEKGNQK